MNGQVRFPVFNFSFPFSVSIFPSHPRGGGDGGMFLFCLFFFFFSLSCPDPVKPVVDQTYTHKNALLLGSTG